MFNSVIFNYRKGSKSQPRRNRAMQIEALEARELLSVSPTTEFQDLAAAYSTIPFSENSNYIDITELTVENLHEAIDQACQTVEDDVIVIHTTETANTISLDGSALIFDVNSDLYGSITLVGYGESMLTISNTQENVAIVYSGDVFFAGISFLAKESEGQSFQTDNVALISEDANVVYEHMMFAVEETSSGAMTDEQIDIDPDDVSMEASSSSKSHRYKLSINFSGSKWAYIAGLTLSDYYYLQTWPFQYEQTVEGEFIDAEKDLHDDDDDLLCWAATASNVLWYTGWANPYLKDSNGDILFNNEDDVFQYFQEYFTDATSSSSRAIKWFLTGDYDAPESWAQLEEYGGGAFYPNVNTNKITGYKDVDSASDMELINKLQEGYGLGMSVALYDPGDVNSRHDGHAITAWGYVYDTSYSGVSYYQGLLVTDSDNNKKDSISGRNAVDTLSILDISWDYSMSKYRIREFYKHDNYYLDGFSYLASYESVYPPVQLSAPSLNVTATSSSTISVSIGSVANASGYYLEYSTSPNFTNAITRNIDEYSRSFNLYGLETNTTYYFRVKALGSLNYSDSSYNAKSVTTNKIKLGVPALSVVATGGDSVSVTIDSVQDATGYYLEYSTSPGFVNSSARTVYESNRTFSIYGLETNTTYYFRAKAIGSGNLADSDFSSIQSATPMIIELPPPILSVNPISGISSVSVTISTVENASGYKLEYSTNPNFRASTTTNISAGSTTITGLTPNTQYYFRVMTIGTGIYVNSVYSDPETVITDRIKLLSPLLNVSAIDSSSVSVTFNTSLNSSGYVLEYSTDPDFSVVTTMNIDTETPTVGGLTIGDLEANTTYYFRVMAIGEGDYTNSNYSTVKSTTTSCITLDAPTLSVEATGVDTISVTVGRVANASGYTLEYATTTSFTNSTTVDVQAGVTVVNELTANTKYYFRVMAHGTGSYTDSDYSSTEFAKTYAPLPIDNVGDAFSTAKEILFANNTFAFTDKLGEGDYGLKDVDLYILTVSSADIGRSYTFSTSQPENGTAVDTYIRLFDSSGSQLAYNDDAKNISWYSSLTWSPTTAGTYYLGVTSFLNKNYDPALAGSATANGVRGDYTLTVTRTAMANNLPAPTLAVTATGSDSVSVTVGSVTNASDYTLQYSANSNFSSSTTKSVSAGTSSVTGLTPGATYYFRVMAKGSGNYSDSDFCAAKSVTLSSQESCPMDIDGDGYIGISDYSLLSKAWRTTPGKANWNPQCDIDGDGYVGISDYTFLSKNWRKYTTDPGIVYPGAVAGASEQAPAAAMAANVPGLPDLGDGNIELLAQDANKPVAVAETIPQAISEKTNAVIVSIDNSDKPTSTNAVLLASENKSESSMTLREAYSAALLDLYDNQELSNLLVASDVLTESRAESPIVSKSDNDSLKTSNDVIAAVLEEELLAINWNN